MVIALVTAASFAVASGGTTKTAESRSTGAQGKTSAPLAWIRSDLNPETVFFVQGRFVPVDDPKFQGDAAVVTILCTIREYECFELDSEVVHSNVEDVWTQEFKPTTWDKDGIAASYTSIDGCTDETLKIRFNPLSVIAINSPVLPMSKDCQKINSSWDRLIGEKGSALKGQIEQDMLVPTRGLVPFEDSAEPVRNH
jgi:hypothetical protein